MPDVLTSPGTGGAPRRERHLPTLAELRRAVWKPEYESYRPGTAMWLIGPAQVYVTYALVRLRVSSIGATVLWFVVVMAGYALLALGRPVATMAGCGLVLLKIVLDGVDGEIARHEKQFVSEADDLCSFVTGVYLDKSFHAVERPLWALAIGWGLATAHAQPLAWAAAVALSVHSTFTRFQALLLEQLPAQFARRVAAVTDRAALQRRVGDGPGPDSLVGRVADRLDLWLRNGKRFNLLVFSCAFADAVLAWTGRPPGVLLAAFMAAGAIAPLLILRTIRHAACDDSILRDLLRATDRR